MNYMLLIYTNESGPESRQTEVPGCGNLVEKLQARGQYIAGGRLQPTNQASSLRVRDGRNLVTDGPFAETREQLAGYLLIDVENLDQAISVAAEHPAAAYGTVEIRPLMYVPALEEKVEATA